MESSPPTDDPQDRVHQITGWLDADPARHLAPSRHNRAAWERLATGEPAARERILPLAEDFLRQPIPTLTDAEYRITRESGEYEGYTRKAEHRRNRLTVFTLAEGLENGGRFLPAINREVAAICSERLWVMPPHDWNRVNFEGIRIDNDLMSAMTAWALAAADTILGDGLEPAVREAVRGRIRQTVTGPFQAAIRGLRPPEWWATNLHNWNAVVHAGIVGAALMLDEYSTAERAEMIAAAERAAPLYLSGFPGDGYSPEGIGYWRYGFGHFTLMAEAVLTATGGRVSFYESARARLVATFPERFEMTRGSHFYPPFSDARFPEPPAPWLRHILDQRYGLGGDVRQTLVPEGDFAHGFFSTFLYAWGMVLSFEPTRAQPWHEEDKKTPGTRLVDWFEDSQILVTRLPAERAGLGAAVKGGHNGVSHGHNDLGTFIVTVGETPVLVDPGLIVYGPLAFGPKRFENQIQGSYGHPVPLVAGQWQGTGKTFHASVREHDFTETFDKITFDLTHGYPVPSLRSLTRTFVFDRADRGTLTVQDRVEFDSPQTFGVALVTYGEAHEEASAVWILSKDGARVRVLIDAGATPVTVTNEVMRDEARAGKVRRLGIDLRTPAATAEILVHITPLS